MCSPKSASGLSYTQKTGQNNSYPAFCIYSFIFHILTCVSSFAALPSSFPQLPYRLLFLFHSLYRIQHPLPVAFHRLCTLSLLPFPPVVLPVLPVPLHSKYRIYFPDSLFFHTADRSLLSIISIISLLAAISSCRDLICAASSGIFSMHSSL